MVQFLPARGFGAGFTQAFPEAFKAEQESQMRQREKQAEMQSKLLGKGQEIEADKENYEIIKDKFGESFADVWKAHSDQGRNALLKNAIESNLRKEDLNELLGGIEPSTQPSAIPTEEPSIPQIKNGKIASDFQFPDYTKRPPGYLPKDWADEKKEWRKQNSTNFEESKKKLQGMDRDVLGVKKLNKLNESRKVGEGFGRTLINPNTGEFYGISQLTGAVPKEAQEWVKEIARFGNRAKDAFGSRVTNFDLQQYMKQFPGLLNTYEGRRNILRMMEINYQLDSLYDNVSQQILRKKGLNGIPPEEVDRIAKEMIRDESERLRQEYLNIDEENQNQPLEGEVGIPGQAKAQGQPSLQELFG